MTVSGAARFGSIAVAKPWAQVNNRVTQVAVSAVNAGTFNHARELTCNFIHRD